MIHLYLRNKTGNILQEILIFAFCPDLHAINVKRMDYRSMRQKWWKKVIFLLLAIIDL